MDRTGQCTIAHRTEERCAPEGKHTAVHSHRPVARSVRVGRDADHERVQRLASRGPRELGIPEGEHATVPRHEPVPVAIRGAGDPGYGGCLLYTSPSPRD